MQDLNTILDQLIAEKPRAPMEQDERNARSAVIAALFVTKGITDGSEQTRAKAQQLVIETEEIPFSVLVLAVKGLIRAHGYKDVPRTKDILDAASYVAGMRRRQWVEPHGVNCSYYKFPTGWPPEGKRHGACRGEFEMLPVVSVKALSDPQRAARELGE